jgi:hypothetical protein
MEFFVAWKERNSTSLEISLPYQIKHLFVSGGSIVQVSILLVVKLVPLR